MFLATTQIDHFWHKSEEIVFLADWCLNEDVKAKLSEKPYTVMPSPWDESEQRQRGIGFCDNFYNRALSQLVDVLNNIHQVSFSIRYWKIIIGPWLFFYINSLYDRYTRMQICLKKYPDLRLIGMPSDCYMLINDWDDFFIKIYSDVYNMQLFTQIVEKLGISYEIGEVEYWSTQVKLLNKSRQDVKQKYSLKAKFFQGVRRGIEGLVVKYSRNKRILVSELFNRYSNHYYLFMATNFKIGLLTRAVNTQTKNSILDPSVQMRQEFENISIPSDDVVFSTMFVELIKQNFPMAYLEGYDFYRKQAIKLGVNRDIIASTYGWKSNELFKFLAAEAQSKGAVLLGSQHGGNSGIEKDLVTELQIVKSVDHFYTFGRWAKTNSDYPNDIEGTAEEFNPGFTNKKVFVDNKKPLLFVGTNIQKYLLFIRHCSYACNFREYQNWQIRFIKKLPKAYRQRFIFRLREYLWESEKILKDKFGDLKFDNLTLNFEQRVAASSMVVIDNLNTTFTQTILMNKPVILFLDRYYLKTYSDAEKILTQLHSVGILHYSPEDAADWLLEIIDEIESWWFSEKVQNARAVFIDQFAVAGKSTWLQQWKKLLNKENLQLLSSSRNLINT